MTARTLPRGLLLFIAVALAAAPMALGATPVTINDSPDEPLSSHAAEGGCLDAKEDPKDSALLAMDATILPIMDSDLHIPQNHDRTDLTDTCPGIRPGSALVLPAGPVDLAYCTLAFLIEDNNGTLYAATAGHCVDPDLGAPTEDIRVHGVDQPIGDVAFEWCEGGDSTGQGCGVGMDFALIELNDPFQPDSPAFNKDLYDEHVNPAMCHWGAPTGGIFDVQAHDDSPMAVQHFGWGMIFGHPLSPLVLTANPATQDREGIAIDYADDTALVQTAAFSGDSGSAALIDDLDIPLQVREDPQALGVITHISNAGTFVQLLDASLSFIENKDTYTGEGLKLHHGLEG